MSKKKRHRNEDGGGDAGHASGRAPGKGTRSGKLSAPDSEAASTDAPGSDGSDAEVGACDVGVAPFISSIIDIAVRDEDTTQVTVTAGTERCVTESTPAQLIAPGGRHLASAEVKRVDGIYVFLTTSLSMEQIDAKKAQVKFGD